MATIYKITNNVNDMIYVGVTKFSIEKRWKEHVRDSKKSVCNYRPLYRDMNKYGIDKFNIEIIEECLDEKSFEREIYYINKLNSFRNGYNNTEGGSGASFCNKELIYILYVCGLIPKRISEITGYDKSGISRFLHSIGVLQETLRKMAAKSNSKAILMYSKNDEYIKTFQSFGEAAEFINKPKSNGWHISEACKGIRKSAYGYHWKFDS